MPSSVPTAVITAWGEAPVVHDLPAPQPSPGHTLVELLAAGVNPVDLAIGTGRFYLPLPDPPFAAGVEAVGRVVQSSTFREGDLVWCLRPTGGCWAAVFAAPDDRLVPVAAGADPVVAVTMGVAGLAGWMPVVSRGELQEGETVVVLGATGAVGQVAVQAARARGAGRVVAVGRNPARLEAVQALGADAVVAIGEDDDLADRIAAVCPERVNLVIDTLWGMPMAQVVPSLAAGARIVQVGSAAGATSVLPAGPLRGGRIDIRGFSVFTEPADEVARAHAALLEAADAGTVTLPAVRYALADVADAWFAQAGGAGGKLVLMP